MLTTGLLNGFKGRIWGPAGEDLENTGFVGRYINAGPNKAVQSIGRVIAAFRIMKNEARVRQLWTKSNKRIYNMFQGVDKFVQSRKLKRVKAADSDMKQDGPLHTRASFRTSQEAVKDEKTADEGKKELACKILADLAKLESSDASPGSGYYSGFSWDYDFSGDPIPARRRRSLLRKRQDDNNDNADSCPFDLPSNPEKPSKPDEPEQKCAGIDTDTYVEQPVLAGNIKDFCEEAAKQGVQDKDSGSISRDFNKDTPNAVSIAITWPPGLPDFKPSEEDCNKFVGAMIMDGCDGNDPRNPKNYKHGGTVGVGQVTYEIKPTAQQLLPICTIAPGSLPDQPPVAGIEAVDSSCASGHSRYPECIPDTYDKGLRTEVEKVPLPVEPIPSLLRALLYVLHMIGAVVASVKRVAMVSTRAPPTPATERLIGTMGLLRWDEVIAFGATCQVGRYQLHKEDMVPDLEVGWKEASWD
ncbi:MAG: hypothetical protein M1816_003096 [Peltula sp. TS41687]|nr:MAG: hypothetical protein M1816_003096 [Peltula sp. TS41687]